MKKEKYISEEHGSSSLGGTIEIGERLVAREVEPLLRLMGSRGAKFSEIRAAVCCMQRALIYKSEEIIREIALERRLKKGKS